VAIKRKGVWSLWAAFLILAVLFTGCVFPAEDDGNIVKVKVKCVASCRLDGDTIRVIMPDGSEEKVRLTGVNTPELAHFGRPQQCGAKDARDFTDKLTGKYVWLGFDVAERDKYGRLLAYVWIKDPRKVHYDLYYMWNWILVREGYAQVMTVPPNVKYADEFVDAQRKARAENKGLWRKCK